MNCVQGQMVRLLKIKIKAETSVLIFGCLSDLSGDSAVHACVRV